MPKTELYSRLSAADKRKYNKKLLLIANSIVKKVRDDDLELDDLLKHKAFKDIDQSALELMGIKDAVKHIAAYATDELFANSMVSKYNELTGDNYKRAPDEELYQTKQIIRDLQDNQIRDEIKRRNLTGNALTEFQTRALANKNRIFERKDPVFNAFPQKSSNHAPIRDSGKVLAQRNVETDEVALNPDLVRLLEDIKLDELEE